MDITSTITIGLAGYLLGAFPTGFLVVKYFAKKSILEWGTGNVGTLNTFRATKSRFLTLLTFSGDAAKGVLSLAAGYAIADAFGSNLDTGATIGGIMAVFGHNFSVFLRFKGGKGLATGLPVLKFLSPFLAPVWIAIWVVAVLLTRLLVLGQILATVLVPVVAFLAFPENAIPVLLLGVLVFIRHASRIRNIVNRTEPKLYFSVDETTQR